MNTSTSTSTSAVEGHQRRAASVALAENDVETRTITHAPFVLPQEPVRAAVAGHGTFFSATRPLGPSRSLGGDLAPPPHADTSGLPAHAHAVDPKEAEPVTLAMYLFKFGFLFPPLWILGAIILISPLGVPIEFEPPKSGTERRRCVRVRMIRDAEVRWATRCAWALVVLLVGVGGVLVGVFVMLRTSL